MHKELIRAVERAVRQFQEEADRLRKRGNLALASALELSAQSMSRAAFEAQDGADDKVASLIDKAAQGGKTGKRVADQAYVTPAFREALDALHRENAALMADTQPIEVSRVLEDDKGD